MEKLRAIFVKRGVTLSAVAIAGTVSVNAVQATPATLTATICAAKGAAIAATVTTLVNGTIKLMTYAKLKLTLGIIAAILLVGGATTLTLLKDSDSAKTDEALLITPGISVGKVKIGMSMDEVAAVLGEPEKIQGKAMIYDKRFGFSVICNREKIVGDVFCGGGITFKGQTKEGIGIDSSRADLIKAFGQPTSAQPWDVGEERLEYKPLGLAFILKNGKVYHITVRRPQ